MRPYANQLGEEWFGDAPGCAAEHSIQLGEEGLLKAQMCRRRVTLESGKRDWLGKKTQREAASRGTQSFGDVDGRLMRRRHPGPVENEAGSQQQ